MAFSPQEQFALLSSILFLDFKVEENAKLKKKKKTKKLQKPPSRDLYWETP